MVGLGSVDFMVATKLAFKLGVIVLEVTVAVWTCSSKICWQYWCDHVVQLILFGMDLTSTTPGLSLAFLGMRRGKTVPALAGPGLVFASYIKANFNQDRPSQVSFAKAATNGNSIKAGSAPAAKSRAVVGKLSPDEEKPCFLANLQNPTCPTSLPPITNIIRRSWGG